MHNIYNRTRISFTEARVPNSIIQDIKTLKPLAMEKCSVPAGKLVGEGYISQGCGSLRASDNAIAHLVEQRRLPEQGWSDIQIERCLAEIALMDTNNFNGRWSEVARKLPGSCPEVAI